VFLFCLNDGQSRDGSIPMAGNLAIDALLLKEL